MTRTIPGARSRAALGLAVGAAAGRFALQVCEECGTVQYPPRDVCVHCLSDRLPWRDVPRCGTLAASTAAYVAGEPYFRARLPWRTGTVRLDCGPSVVAHLHGACRAGDRVVMDLRLDPAGRGAMFAMPQDVPPGPDPIERALGADPRDRTVLIADGTGATGAALADAFRRAGAGQIFLGVARAPAAADEVALDMADAGSVVTLAKRIGASVDIVVDNAGRIWPGDAEARTMMDVNALGAIALAAAFGPRLQARADEPGCGALAYVTLLSAWCLTAPAGFVAYAASQSARRAASQGLRGAMRAHGVRVVDVLSGPVDDEGHAGVTGPKVSPAALASATIVALRRGREEVVVGEVARDIHARWAADPLLLMQEMP